MTATVFQFILQSFYFDAKAEGLELHKPRIEFAVVYLEDANAKSTKQPDDSWLIEIDVEFYNHYLSSEGDQLKRLVYHELAHILLGLKDTKDGNVIMNPERMYKPLKKEHIKTIMHQ